MTLKHIAAVLFLSIGLIGCDQKSSPTSPTPTPQPQAPRTILLERFTFGLSVKGGGVGGYLNPPGPGTVEVSVTWSPAEDANPYVYLAKEYKDYRCRDSWDCTGGFTPVSIMEGNPKVVTFKVEEKREYRYMIMNKGPAAITSGLARITFTYPTEEK